MVDTADENMWYGTVRGSEWSWLRSRSCNEWHSILIGSEIEQGSVPLQGEDAEPCCIRNDN
ncbi:coenzyme PQQ synthesis protein E [Paenibacillus sp. NAIST15-1]|nr:coenzyme PQQ synthesis protein E [Paenibacillus sp. NAIST15-1]